MLGNLFSLAGFLKLVRYIFSFPYGGSNNFAKFSLTDKYFQSPFLQLPTFSSTSSKPSLDSVLEAWSGFLSSRPFGFYPLLSPKVMAASHFWYQNLFQLLFQLTPKLSGKNNGIIMLTDSVRQKFRQDRALLHNVWALYKRDIKMVINLKLPKKCLNISSPCGLGFLTAWQRQRN